MPARVKAENGLKISITHVIKTASNGVHNTNPKLPAGMTKACDEVFFASARVLAVDSIVRSCLPLRTAHPSRLFRAAASRFGCFEHVNKHLASHESLQAETACSGSLCRRNGKALGRQKGRQRLCTRHVILGCVSCESSNLLHIVHRADGYCAGQMLQRFSSSLLAWQHTCSPLQAPPAKSRTHMYSDAIISIIISVVNSAHPATSCWDLIRLSFADFSAIDWKIT